LFGTLIGLVRGGSPWLGAISHPAQGLVLIGDGKTTTGNGKKARHRKCTELDEALLLATDPRGMLRPDFGALAEKVEHVRTWGDCFGYTQVATGFADIMIDPIMNPWDLLPLVPVLEGAGVTITDLAGEPITMESNSSVAANPKLHEQVIEILRENA
jgi:myo-inositol-1(or 4)-monophosphatase